MTIPSAREYTTEMLGENLTIDEALGKLEKGECGGYIRGKHTRAYLALDNARMIEIIKRNIGVRLDGSFNLDNDGDVIVTI